MAVALALLAAVGFGGANYLGPRLARGAPILLLVLMAQGAAMVLSGLVVLAQHPAAPSGAAVLWAVVAGAGNAGGTLALYRAATLGPLTVVSPLGSLGVALPILVGLADGEGLTPAQAGGLALALVGLGLVSRRATLGATRLRADADFDRPRVLGLSLVNALGYGIFLIAMRPAADAGAGWAVLVSRASVVAWMLVVGLAVGTFAGVRRVPPARFAAPGVLLFGGILAYAAATRHGTLVTVSVLGSRFPVITVALAFTLDHERLTRAAAVGVAVVIAGVVLLSSG